MCLKPCGRCSFFITFTFNPKWPEADVRPRRIADYVDIQCRVFNLRLKSFLRRLRAGQFFGGRNGPFRGEPPVYIMCVVEFQKRGFPHAHLAVKMPVDPTDPEVIDELITARMPPHPDTLENPTPDDRIYYDLVRANLTHRRCVEGRCFQHGLPEGQRTCKWGYPHAPNAMTYFDEKGFCKPQRLTRADAYVVPHNRELVLWLRCHVNVELAHSVTIISYLR